MPMLTRLMAAPGTSPRLSAIDQLIFKQEIPFSMRGVLMVFAPKSR